MSATADFFQVGAALGEDSPSYIERRADDELLSALERHELCLVLAPRQTGKSSLMVHALSRLQTKGVRAGIVDLQPLGSQADIDLWFRDVLYQIERSLELETDSYEWWTAPGRPGATQRFMGFLEDVVLQEATGDVVLFFDEIDSVLPLPFADDFFTTLRSLYNARAHKPVLRRLTFVLLGVATPSSFIRDRTRTPFNIGASIALDDFDRAAVEPFRAALGPGTDPLVDRIFYWTNGQPLLVQRLASVACSWAPEERTAERIDAEVRKSYLEGKVEQDTHLKFIRDYLLDGTTDVRETLETYEEVLAGKRVADDRQSIAQNRLKLAGVVRSDNGQLVVRNRIYASIFDLEWARENLRSQAIQSPLQRWLDSGRQDDYLLRGKALEEALEWSKARADRTPEERDFLMAAVEAARREERARVRGQRRLILVLSAMTVVMVALALATAWSGHKATIAASVARKAEARAKVAAAQERAAKQRALQSATAAQQAEAQARTAAAAKQAAARREAAARMEAERLRRLAEDQGRIARSREIASYSIAQLPVDPQGDRQLSLLLALEALRVDRTKQAVEALRQSLLPVDAHLLLQGHTDRVNSAAYSPDNQSIVTASADHTARVWKTHPCRTIATLRGHTEPVLGAAYSPDGRFIVTASEDETARVWVARTGQTTAILRGHTGSVYSATYSPDGQFIVTAGNDHSARVRAARTGQTIAILQGHKAGVYSGAYSPDGRFIVTASQDKTARVWEARTGQTIAILQGHKAGVYSGAYSPDGRFIVTASQDKTARVWEARTGRTIVILRGHTDPLTSAAYSGDGRFIVTASYDRTARVWEARTGRTIAILRGHTAAVGSAAYSPDGRFIVTASDDQRSRVYPFKDYHSLEDLLALARQRVRRQLTAEERARYLHEREADRRGSGRSQHL